MGPKFGGKHELTEFSKVHTHFNYPTLNQFKIPYRVKSVWWSWPRWRTNIVLQHLVWVFGKFSIKTKLRHI